MSRDRENALFLCYDCPVLANLVTPACPSTTRGRLRHPSPLSEISYENKATRLIFSSKFFTFGYPRPVLRLSACFRQSSAIVQEA